MTYMPVFIGPAGPTKPVFSIQEAVSASQRRGCVRLAWDVYRGDRYWAPPLIGPWLRALQEREGALGLFFAEARNIGWGDQVIGAIATWPDPDDREPAACFGLFEAVNDQDVADALFEAAETWAFEHVAGVTALRGPFSLDGLGAAGLLVDGFDVPAAAFLPYNPPYYPESLELAGYEPVQETRTWLLDLPLANSRTQAAADARRTAEQGLRVRTVAGGAAAGLCGAAFRSAAASGGAPGRASAHLRPLFRRALAAVAEVDGQPVAGVAALADVAPGLRWANGRLLPFGWLPYGLAAHRAARLRAFPVAVPTRPPGFGAEAALYRALCQAAAEAGWQQIEIGPLQAWDEPEARALRDLGARPARGFRLYEKRFG